MASVKVKIPNIYTAYQKVSKYIEWFFISTDNTILNGPELYDDKQNIQNYSGGKIVVGSEITYTTNPGTDGTNFYYYYHDYLSLLYGKKSINIDNDIIKQVYGYLAIYNSTFQYSEGKWDAIGVKRSINTIDPPPYYYYYNHPPVTQDFLKIAVDCYNVSHIKAFGYDISSYFRWDLYGRRLSTCNTSSEFKDESITGSYGLSYIGKYYNATYSLVVTHKSNQSYFIPTFDTILHMIPWSDSVEGVSGMYSVVDIRKPDVAINISGEDSDDSGGDFADRSAVGIITLDKKLFTKDYFAIAIPKQYWNSGLTKADWITIDSSGVQVYGYRPVDNNLIKFEAYLYANSLIVEVDVDDIELTSVSTINGTSVQIQWKHDDKFNLPNFYGWRIWTRKVGLGSFGVVNKVYDTTGHRVSDGAGYIRNFDLKKVVITTIEQSDISASDINNDTYIPGQKYEIYVEACYIEFAMPHYTNNNLITERVDYSVVSNISEFEVGYAIQQPTIDYSLRYISYNKSIGLAKWGLNVNILKWEMVDTPPEDIGKVVVYLRHIDYWYYDSTTGTIKPHVISESFEAPFGSEIIIDKPFGAEYTMYIVFYSKTGLYRYALFTNGKRYTNVVFPMNSAMGMHQKTGTDAYIEAGTVADFAVEAFDAEGEEEYVTFADEYYQITNTTLIDNTDPSLLLIHSENNISGEAIPLHEPYIGTISSYDNYVSDSQKIQFLWKRHHAVQTAVADRSLYYEAYGINILRIHDVGLTDVNFYDANGELLLGGRRYSRAYITLKFARYGEPYYRADKEYLYVYIYLKAWDQDDNVWRTVTKIVTVSLVQPKEKYKVNSRTKFKVEILDSEVVTEPYASISQLHIYRNPISSTRSLYEKLSKSAGSSISNVIPVKINGVPNVVSKWVNFDMELNNPIAKPYRYVLAFPVEIHKPAPVAILLCDSSAKLNTDFTLNASMSYSYNEGEQMLYHYVIIDHHDGLDTVYNEFTTTESITTITFSQIRTDDNYYRILLDVTDGSGQTSDVVEKQIQVYPTSMGVVDLTAFDPPHPLSPPTSIEQGRDTNGLYVTRIPETGFSYVKSTKAGSRTFNITGRHEPMTFRQDIDVEELSRKEMELFDGLYQNGEVIKIYLPGYGDIYAIISEYTSSVNEEMDDIYDYNMKLIEISPDQLSGD